MESANAMLVHEWFQFIEDDIFMVIPVTHLTSGFQLATVLNESIGIMKLKRTQIPDSAKKNRGVIGKIRYGQTPLAHGHHMIAVYLALMTYCS